MSSADATTWRARAWAHIQEVEALGGMAKAIEQGIPKLRIEEAAARTQARIDSGRRCGGRRQQVPPETDRRLDVLKVDNNDRLPQQIEKLNGCAPSATTTTSTRADGADERARRGNGNLLALAVDAARAKATVGEISDALEKVYGRHRAVIRTISGVYRGGRAPIPRPPGLRR
jgi:methylmalonyl-CoA mutase